MNIFFTFLNDNDDDEEFFWRFLYFSEIFIIKHKFRKIIIDEENLCFSCGGAGNRTNRNVCELSNSLMAVGRRRAANVWWYSQAVGGGSTRDYSVAVSANALLDDFMLKREECVRLAAENLFPWIIGGDC